MGTYRYRDRFHSVVDCVYVQCHGVENLASSVVSEVNEGEEGVDTADSHPGNVAMEAAEYDSSTDEDEEVEGGGSGIPELDRRSTFLLGTTTCFG